MSAWIVSKTHIDRMVRTAIDWRLVVRPDATELGRLLWGENLKSVAYRYPHDGDGERPGPLNLSDREIENYEYTGGEPLTPNEALNASACLNYQSCEHDGWMGSAARQFLDLFEEEARKQGADKQSPEYDRAPWGF